jgi:hypothetical protein
MCLVCSPGYQLVKQACIKCGELEGYDATTKECFTGTVVSNAEDTQYLNIKTFLTQIDLHQSHFAVTVKLDIAPELFLHNQIFLFVNNVDNANRVVDTCWGESCEMSRSINFSMTQRDGLVNISNILVGNSGKLAIVPVIAVMRLKLAAEFSRGPIIHKNFDCRIIDNTSYYQAINSINGNCVTQCAMGHFADKETGRCVNCNIRCASCDNELTCSSCISGFVLIDGQCIPSVPVCLTCSVSQPKPQSSLPEIMANKPTVNSNNICKDSEARHCQTCNSITGLCDSCIQNFTLKDGVCSGVTCNVPNCQGCQVSGVCQACKGGYQLDNGGCSVCTASCQSCPVGYELSNTGSCEAVTKSQQLTQVFQTQVKAGSILSMLAFLVFSVLA